jgi:NADH-quinone oxidoreductase subunit L
MLVGTQIFVGLAILYAYRKYMSNKIAVPDGTSKMENSFMYKLLINQYYIPYAYDEYIVKPYNELSAALWKVDQNVVDASVDGIANIFYKTGENTRHMQSGNLSTMLKWMVAGTVALLSLAVVFGLAARYSGEILTILSGLGV